MAKFNYTAKKEKAKKLLLNHINGKDKIDSISDLLRKSGYSEKSLNNMQIRMGIYDIIEELYSLETRVIDLMKIKDDGEASNGDKINTIREINKMAGSYAPAKTESITTNLIADLDEDVDEDKLEKIIKKLRQA